MRFRVRLRGWHLYMECYHSARFEGVNSILEDGNHFLMWDFDGKAATEVAPALREKQRQFKLPTIYLVNTGKPDSWHAYCFKRMEWSFLLFILSSTEGIDQTWFKIGVVRGFFTLRYTPKGKREFKPAIVLPGKSPDDVNPYELTSFAKFWSMRL